MKKINRGLGNEEFQRIIAKGKYASSKFFVLYWIPREYENSRMGIAVSKKIGNAVRRNKIRRQVKSIALEVYDFAVPFDIVVMVRKEYLKLDHLEKKNDLENLIKKIS